LGISALRTPRIRARLQPAFRAIARALNLWLRNASYERVLRARWDALVDLYAEQALRSAAFEERARSMPAGELRAAGVDAEGQNLRRRHHQLPCTAATLRERIRVISTICSRDAPILLAGDDDMLSLALAEAGFTDVTALDIDPAVLDQIHIEAQLAGRSVQIVQHDLSQRPPAAFVRDYALVVTDPICTPDGVRLFLQGALRMVTPHGNVRVLLCTHLASQLPEGLEQLEDLLNANDLVIERFLPGCGVYPNPRRLMRVVFGVLWFLDHTCLRSEGITLAATTPKYFVSDALVLRARGPQASRLPRATVLEGVSPQAVRS